MIHKLLIPMMLLAGALCFAGCVEDRNELEDGGSSSGGSSSGGGGSSSGSGSSGKTYNYWTDDCATMGGQTLPSGACYIKCNSDDDCKNIIGATRCRGSDKIQNCLPDRTETCPPGWVGGGTTDCGMACNGENDTTSCSSDHYCEYVMTWDFQIGGPGESRYECYPNDLRSDTGSGSGGGGYCAQLGCGGIFCSGKCIGCPGC